MNITTKIISSIRLCVYMYVLFIVPPACFSLRGLLQSEFYMLNVIVIMGGGGGGTECVGSSRC